MDSTSFAGRVVIVTGSAQGIGFHIAESFAQHGANVVLSDNNGTKLEEALQRLVRSGGKAAAIQADVTLESDIARLITQTAQRFGRLDVLINNAGIQHVAPIEDFPTEKFELMLKIMLTAPFIAMKHALPHMKQQGYGRILNLSSINGLVGFAGKAAYNSAKHGVIGLTKVAALEAAPFGITVNALCPGYVDTPLVRGQLQELARTRQVPLEKVLEEVIFPLVPQRRLLETNEVADYALFLASDRAKGVTGQAVVLDGGYTAQ
ncbi:3-hydroxybutyrate dehydrogenase [Paenibacillus mendelii]|uniref:3-hydroxybutyrate dehydrogenase n=1 Tax=Paenibacillus mendelii TaxID=206163 RepID=A0ABV6JF93_9BACL|nr:3-hydroxybutyrate dehydrogenase [Paenibacillus mendelii]MCQ6557340.1 3-hydroxybutyrate dehydrogenase [Paenibacillus mendelii]